MSVPEQPDEGITEAMVEAAAKAAVEWESDQCERDTDGAAYLDRWDALSDEGRAGYRSQARPMLTAALAARPTVPEENPNAA